MQHTDGSLGFEKVGIDGNGTFVEDGIISTVSGESFVLGVRDSEFGLFHDRASADVVNVFNPTTMEVTGTIDMSVANAVNDTAAVRYQDFIFRGTNEVFALSGSTTEALNPIYLSPRSTSQQVPLPI